MDFSRNGKRRFWYGDTRHFLTILRYQRRHFQPRLFILDK